MSKKDVNRKVLVIFGTRPEAIKLAVVIHELKKIYGIRLKVCVTAQHRQMLDQVLSVFSIKPDYDLNVMKKNQDLFDITSSSLRRLREVLLKELPDMVIVQGDTTTTFAASLAAYYLRIPVAHVEAGLRTDNKYAPFPEEINRRLSGDLADYHFAPTRSAFNNLLREGVCKKSVWVTGNTVIDSLLYISAGQGNKAKAAKLRRHFKAQWRIDLSGKDTRRLVLVTLHRRESFGDKIKGICAALKELALIRDDVRIIYPVHLNPNVQKAVRDNLRNVGNVYLTAPLDYESFVFLMNRSYLVLTDSGGVQEEAPSLSKPVLVVRDTTERPEGLKAGTSVLVGTDKKLIIKTVCRLLDDKKAYKRMTTAVNPYGDGKAAGRIAEVIKGILFK